MKPPALCLLLVLIGAALGRVAATWPVYTPTYDEPYHLAGGMQWLDQQVYQYGQMHPPLARVAVALGPYLSGYHSQNRTEIWDEGNAILNQKSQQQRAIVLARAGVLPFLVLAILVVFAWARWLAGDAVALLAVLAFTCVPPVLAHSGLATTDAAAMATIAACLYALLRWLESPTWPRTAGLGVAAGLALLAKMSSLIYLPIAGAVFLASWISAGNRVSFHLRRTVPALAIAFLVLWSGYRFSVGPVRADLSGKVTSASAPVYPAPEFLSGFMQMLGENAKGRRSFLLGERYIGGRWYYFPVALAVKTPLPFVFLAGLGSIILLKVSVRRRPAAAPMLGAGVILLTALPARLNIGVRHVLPIFPMLAICAGVGMYQLWSWRRHPSAGRLLSVGLASWLVIESVRAHPDYLPYFNQLAGKHPENVLVSGDLDWGQDLGRLVDTLRLRHIQHISLAYFGKVDLTRQGLPPFTEVRANRPVTGWIAASIYCLQLGEQRGSFDAYAWLRSYTPVARVGQTIRLYYITPN